MIKLKDFFNAVNPNTTLNVYLDDDNEPQYEYFTAYDIKQELPKLIRLLGYQYVSEIDCLDSKVDMAIRIVS